MSPEICPRKERAKEFARNTDAKVENQAGPGAHEIRTPWMVLAGALEDVAYEPVKAWATGCALASLQTA